MRRIKIHKSFEDERLKKYWKKIYKKSSFCPQSSYEWTYIWWKHFQKRTRELFIITIEEKDIILGIAPFMIEKNVFLRQLKFIGSGLTDFHEILAHDSQKEDILKTIVNFILKSKQYDIINLEQISDHSKLYHVLKQNKRFQIRKMVKCPIINFSSMTWEEYLQKLGKNIRRDWKKKYNKLNKKSNLKLIRLNNIQSIKKHLNKMISLHIRRWESENRLSKLSRKYIQRFILSIAKEVPETIVYILVFNKEIISYRIGFIKRKIFYDWNTSYEPKYYAYSPGKILLGLVIKDLIENNYKKLNFMRGNEEYKNKWIIDSDVITNYQFICKISFLKGYVGIKYYLKWKWWIKRNFHNVLDYPIFQKLLLKLKY